MPGTLQLVLIGKSVLPVPSDRRVRYLGFLGDEDKFDAMAAADVLVMPSYYESLSMVALEAWALGKPVLANAKCDVLKGQALQKQCGALLRELRGVCRGVVPITSSPSLSDALGRNGRTFFRTHYAWPVIERKYLETFDRLARQPTAEHPVMAPLPGFFASRARRCCPPAAEVVAGVPPGPCADEPPCGPPGAGDARLRRRHRARGARYPARPARGRLRLGDLRRDG